MHACRKFERNQLTAEGIPAGVFDVQNNNPLLREMGMSANPICASTLAMTEGSSIPYLERPLRWNEDNPTYATAKQKILNCKEMPDG